MYVSILGRWSFRSGPSGKASLPSVMQDRFSSVRSSDMLRKYYCNFGRCKDYVKLGVGSARQGSKFALACMLSFCTRLHCVERGATNCFSYSRPSCEVAGCRLEKDEPEERVWRREG